MGDESPYVLGIDIGVTNVKWACVTPAGRALGRGSFDTNAQSPDWPGAIRDFVRQSESERGAVRGIGIAAPGLAAPDGSCIAWMQGRLDAVERLNWTQFLARDQPVPVLNDAQAALLGEAWLGAAAGSRNVMLLTLGTGVGGALMVDDHLLRGQIGRAGHLGHVCLDPDGTPDITNAPGSLENAIGNCTIGDRSGGRFTSTHDLIDAHLSGDADATRIWLRSIHLLACGIASLINVADPEIVIIGGGIARSGRALFDPLEDELSRFEWRPHGQRARILPAALGEYAGALGSAKNAIDPGLAGPSRGRSAAQSARPVDGPAKR